MMLFVSYLFTARAAGKTAGAAVLALVSCAPTQIIMAQRAMMDGVFAFGPYSPLWVFLQNLQPGNIRWLSIHAFSLAGNHGADERKRIFRFTWAFWLSLVLNHWFRFGRITRTLLLHLFGGAGLGSSFLSCWPAALAWPRVFTRSSQKSLPCHLLYNVETGHGIVADHYLIDSCWSVPCHVACNSGIFSTEAGKPKSLLTIFLEGGELCHHVEREAWHKLALRKHAGHAVALPGFIQLSVLADRFGNRKN